MRRAFLINNNQIVGEVRFNETLPEAPPNHRWIENNSDGPGTPRVVGDIILWEVSLADAKKAKDAELRALCHADISGGFTSNALGSPHRYSSEPEDQINLMGAVIGAPAEGTLSYVCTNTLDIKAARPHTKAQLQQVYANGMQHKAERIYKYHTLREAVLSAGTHEQVQSVAW